MTKKKKFFFLSPLSYSLTLLFRSEEKWALERGRDGDEREGSAARASRSKSDFLSLLLLLRVGQGVFPCPGVAKMLPGVCDLCVLEELRKAPQQLVFFLPLFLEDFTVDEVGGGKKSQPWQESD